MDGFVRDFSLPRLERVISGDGSIARLGAELDRLHATRLIIVTGRTLGASPLLDRVRTQAGAARCVAVFRDARQHTPADTVDALAALIAHERADAVVSFGGGSPIDTVKGAVHRLIDAAADSAPVHIAVPTTLSAGEFTAVAGVTDPETRVKHAIYDPRLSPRVVIADPALTIETPAWLWAASGIRALDHAVESIYSRRHHPLSDATAAQAIRMLLAHVVPSLAEGPPEGGPCVRGGRLQPDPYVRGVRLQPDQIEHRAQCQLAAWLAVFGMTNAGFGLSHALGHQIGPRWNVPHGITSCITLAPVMRFMAGVAPRRFEPMAASFGVPFDAADPATAALACAERTSAFVVSLGLPSRLRDVGVPREELGTVAGVVHGIMHGEALDRRVERTELMAVLDMCW